MRKTNLILALLSAALLNACSLLHDDEVVAKVGRKKLFRSEVVKFIPPGTPAEDSLTIARQYINAWAGELLLNEYAAKQLSKQERDVSKELADYKNSLLKYRYERHYIDANLDTVVTQEQMLDRYETCGAQYVLKIPIAKVRYVRVPSTSPLREDLLDLLASPDSSDHSVLDSLSYTVVQKYSDFGDEWIDLSVLAKEYGTDYGTLMAARKGDFIDIVDETGIEHISYIVSYVPSARKAPLEYCWKALKDGIIEQRKYLLSSTLEQNLLNQALGEGYFEILMNDEK